MALSSEKSTDKELVEEIVDMEDLVKFGNKTRCVMLGLSKLGLNDLSVSWINENVFFMFVHFFICEFRNLQRVPADVY